MRSPRNTPAQAAPAAAAPAMQLSFFGEAEAATGRPRARRLRPDQRPLPPAESLKYCNALLAEIDRVRLAEEERVRRLAALYEAAIAHRPGRHADDLEPAHAAKAYG